MNQYFTEKAQVQAAFLPRAMNSGASTGDWVNMALYQRCCIIFFKAVGTAGDDPTITVKQATDVTGAGNKALGFKRVDKKQAATDLTSTGTNTISTSAAPATNDTFNTTNGTWTNTDLAEQAAIIQIDIGPEDMDIANGFTCIQITVADVGTNAQYGCALYVLHDPRQPKQTLDSAIV